MKRLVVWFAGLFLLTLLSCHGFRLDQLTTTSRNYPNTWEGIKERRNAVKNEIRRLKKFGTKYNRNQRARISKDTGSRLPETGYITVFMKPVWSDAWTRVHEYMADHKTTKLLREALYEQYDQGQAVLKRKIDHAVAKLVMPQRTTLLRMAQDQFEQFEAGVPNEVENFEESFDEYGFNKHQPQKKTLANQRMKTEEELQDELDDFDFGFKLFYVALNGGKLNEEDQEVTLLTTSMLADKWIKDAEFEIRRIFDKQVKNDTSVGGTVLKPDGKTEKETFLEEWGEVRCLAFEKEHGYFPWQTDEVKQNVLVEVEKHSQFLKSLEGKTEEEKQQIHANIEEKKQKALKQTGKGPEVKLWELQAKPHFKRESKLLKAGLLARRSRAKGNKALPQGTVELPRRPRKKKKGIERESSPTKSNTGL